MKARIVNKNALGVEGGSQYRTDDDDYTPITVGQIGLVNVNNPITSGSALFLLEVYLFYKDFKHAG